EAIEAVCAGDRSWELGVGATSPTPSSQLPAPILEEVALLLDQNLLWHVEGGESEPRLMMLETIRQYALDCLAASGEAQALQHRHAEYYLALAETADAMLRGPEQELWLAQVEAEHDNLRAALAWYQATDPDRGLRLAGALWRFWEMHSHLSEGRGWLEDMLRLSSAVDGSFRARALNGLGMLMYWLGEYQLAKEPLTESLVLFQELDDEHSKAYVLRSLALAAWSQGDHELARTQLEESVAVYRRLDHSWGIADALHWLGHIAMDQGDLPAAHALFEESLRLFRAIGDRRNIALLIKDFGLIASQQGDYAMGRTLYEESLKLSRADEDTWHIADTLLRLGDITRLQADYERAATLVQEGLELWRKLGNQAGIAEALNRLGEVSQLQGAYQ